jgi:hypothetical protein
MKSKIAAGIRGEALQTLDRRVFARPPASFREIPFWSWNDELDEAELKRQITRFKQGGCGGFFMHARVGLKTPYLGPKWMRCVRTCIVEAHRQGLEAWLYDEDKWPSGYAGGLSVASDPAHRTQYLVCKVDDRPALLRERIAVFAAREERGQLVGIRPGREPKLEQATDRLVQFYVQTMPLGDAWYNGFAYLNLLSPSAVRAFLDSTHEAYDREIGRDFGGTVPGIFTDEPCTAFHETSDRVPRNRVPWDDRLPEIFRKTRGYDLIPELPSLFFETGRYHRVRHDFWRTVTEMFRDAYTRQIADWCRAHRLAYTGHYMSEDTMLSQIQWGQAAVMPHYADMTLPGIDKLGLRINTDYGSILTVKQLDSVVCQTGKPRALCENFGAMGQGAAHRHRKWISDWAYVLGVNLSNPHLSMYSLRGERKRDFPAFLFFQQPWWPDNDLIADYVARLSYALSRGERVTDILVLHPMGSAWALFQPDGLSKVAELDRQLDGLLLTLLQNQRDFHLGDELLMEPGGATRTRVVGKGPQTRLQVGRMAYRLVIVPPGLTITRHTARLLGEFSRAGGAVLAVPPLPGMIDCRPVDRALPESTRTVRLADLPEVLDRVLPWDVRIRARPDIWVQHRRAGDLDIYFLANTSIEQGGPAKIRLKGSGTIEEWDPKTGTVSRLASESDGGSLKLRLDFPPAGSHLLVMRHAGNGNPNPEILNSNPGISSFELRASNFAAWDLVLEDPNALTLDSCRLKIGDGDWSPWMDILDAQSSVRASGKGTPFSLSFAFDVERLPAQPVFLVMETPGEYEITVNGAKVAGDHDRGWWLDRAFRRLDIFRQLRTGHNQILLKGVFSSNIEIESVYLTGSFGVHSRRAGREARFNGLVYDRYRPAARVVALPGRAARRQKVGSLALDLTFQGLPFFAGCAKLSRMVKVPGFKGRAFLELENLQAAIARVRVNGRLAGRIAWHPTRVEITGLLKPGANRLEIELVSTLRNLLGPHHVRGSERDITSPNTFRDKRRWTNDYILMPFGFDRAVIRIHRA